MQAQQGNKLLLLASPREKLVKLLLSPNLDSLVNVDPWGNPWVSVMGKHVE